MARRGRKKKFKLDLKFDMRPDVLKSILAIVFVLLGGLSALSIFAPEYSLNGKVRSVLEELFGSAYVLVPFIMFLIGLLFIDALKLKIKNLRILLGLFVLQLSLVSLIELLGSDGGILGRSVSGVVADAVSKAGAGFIFFLLAAASLILIFHVSINQVVAFVGKSLSSAKESLSSVGLGMKTGNKEDKDTHETQASEDMSGSEERSGGEPEFKVLEPLSEPQGHAKREPLGVETSDSLVSLVPNLPYSDKVWETPPFDLLEDDTGAPPDLGNVKDRERIIKETLKSFNINVGIEDVQPGPAVTQYALSVDSGTKISKIVNLQYEIASALKSPTGSVRIEAPIPGTDRIGIEVPNKNRAVVNFKSLLMSDAMRNTKSRLAAVMGKDVGGNTIVYDIAKMPHMLIAGATGSGKSVFLHSLIFSLLYRTTPQECKLILIDTKRTELVNYGDTPHLMLPVVTELEKAATVFRWAVAEMDRRYKLFEAAKARNIESYNEKSGFQAMSYIVIIVDELADIMIADPTSLEKSIIRLAQLARAAGIHLVLSVQRPSTDVITGLIKANIPCRAAFNVTGQVDSRVIIDQPGAEKLLGKGDMLFMPPDAAKPVRLQGAWVSDREISNLVNYLKARGVQPEYREDILEVPAVSHDRSGTSSGGGDVDILFNEAVDVVTSAGKASASLLQRRLTIGYARAARILDELEERGVVGPQQGSKPRDVLTKRETAEDYLGPDPMMEEEL